MAVTAYLFSQFPKNLAKGLIPDLSDAGTVINLALLTTGASISQENWEALDDVDTDAHEFSGDVYVAGGEEATTKTVTEATKVTTFNAADVTWGSSTITAYYGVLYYDSGTASTSYLIGYIDFGGSKSSSSGDFTVAWNVAGIFTMTVP